MNKLTLLQKLLTAQEKLQKILKTNRGLRRKNSRLKVKLETTASTDSMTGLYNKAYFMSQVDHHLNLLKRMMHGAKPRKKLGHASVVFFDLDGFGILNKGNQIAGDNLLIEFSHFLSKHTRKSDVLARVGGDEFCILLPETTFEQAEQFVINIQNSLSIATFDFKGKRIELHASHGVASTSSNSEIMGAALLEMMDADLLVDTANKVMNMNKQTKKKQ